MATVVAVVSCLGRGALADGRNQAADPPASSEAELDAAIVLTIK